MIWPFIILSYASLFIFGLTDNVRGPLFPDILKEFAVSDSLGSWIFALSSISGFIASYMTRYMLRRFDRKSVLQVSTIALTLSLWGLAASTNFYLFLFFSLCFGLSLGVLGLIPNILVPLGSSPARKQQLLSGLHSMYGLASLCAPLLAAGVTAATGSWRWTFVVGSFGPLALLLYSTHSSHKNLHKKASFSAEDHRTAKKANFKPQIFLALMVSFSVAAEILISSRMALYMRREWNYDLEHSSFYTTYFFISMLVGRGLFSLIKLRTPIRNQLTGALILTAGVSALGLFVHPLFLALAGFTIAPFYPLSISWISSEFPLDLDTAVPYMMATDSMMLIVMHLLTGALTDSFGIHSAMYTEFAYLLCSLILVNSFGYFFRRAPTPVAEA